MIRGEKDMLTFLVGAASLKEMVKNGLNKPF